MRWANTSESNLLYTSVDASRPHAASADNAGKKLVEPDRGALYAACDTRVSVMMANGALEEVRALMGRDLPHGLPIMKAVGVRELSAYLRGETELDDALDIMRQATRNYAKRQLTWFRNQTPDWRRERR